VLLSSNILASPTEKSWRKYRVVGRIQIRYRSSCRGIWQQSWCATLIPSSKVTSFQSTFQGVTLEHTQKYHWMKASNLKVKDHCKSLGEKEHQGNGEVEGMGGKIN
jgi:hypothetical protein